jgi:DNA-directed RNA polymerase subunit omega
LNFETVAIYYREIINGGEIRLPTSRIQNAMPKAVESSNETADANEPAETQTPEIDSKYRLIIVAAQRSKQLQRGARSRVEMDTQRHKPTRVALEEVQRGMVDFKIIERE